MQASHVLFDLIERLHREAGELDFGNWLHAMNRHADRCSDDATLGEWRIHDPVASVTLEQPLGHAEHATIDADILPHDHHVFIGGHRFIKCQVECFNHRLLRHQSCPPIPRRLSLFQYSSRWRSSSGGMLT